jgi:hypothetical protein
MPPSSPQGQIIATHLAGAGDMVTMIIARELGLEDRYLAEEIKSTRWPKSKACFTCAMKTAACSFSRRRCHPRCLPASAW